MAAILGSGKEAITRFVYDEVYTTITATSGPKKINLQSAFAKFLTRNGAPKILAAEHAEKWNTELNSRVERSLRDWELLGVPRPLDGTGDGKTYVTWQHPKFLDITGCAALPAEFTGISEWIEGQKDDSFLFVGACFLSLLKANPIFVTDTSGDGGVDLIGRLNSGPLRSTAVLVQAKSSVNLIDRNVVLAEHGKFLASRTTPTFARYIEALGLNRSGDGCCYLYVMVTNSEYKRGARSAASALGVLLRSRKQIAYWLSRHTNRTKLQAKATDLGGVLKADLTRNVAPIINLLSTVS